MLSPKRVKWRKQFIGRATGFAARGANLDFGDFGLQATEEGRLTARQLEAARIAISRSVKRGGKIWVRVSQIYQLQKNLLKLVWVVVKVILNFGLRVAYLEKFYSK